MGTTYSVKFVTEVLDEVRLAELRGVVDQRLEAINRQVSHYRIDSELSKFNVQTSTLPVKVSAEFAKIVRCALELNVETGGAFDPSLGRLINLWGFGEAGRVAQAPAESQVLACLNMCGARYVRVSEQDELQKDIPGLHLNLSAVAKGYGVDEIARLLMGRGITNFFVQICGEVMAWGHNAGDHPWTVGIQRPLYDMPPGFDIGMVLSVSNRAVSTSGDSYNYFKDEQGGLASHILDPRSGRPLRHRLASVTVLAPTAMTADGVATSLFVMGPEEGLKWIESRADLAALFISRIDENKFIVKASSRFPALQDN